MKLGKLRNIVLSAGLAFATLGSGSAIAATEDAIEGSLLNIGDILQDGAVKTVHGVFTYNESFTIDESGTYSLALMDHDLGENFDFLGAMISTSTRKLASISFREGRRLEGEQMEFSVNADEEEKYWISIFGITDNRFNMGTFGVEVGTDIDLAPIPAPPAIVFMMTSLLGLGALARRKMFKK